MTQAILILLFSCGAFVFEGNTYSRYLIMQINYHLNVLEETFYSSILPHS